MDGYTFVGLIRLQDPPRKGVSDAIKTCNKAGVKVVMVTGDHPYTAEAIARQVGIIESEMTKAEAAKHYNIAEEDVAEDQYGAVVVYGAQIADFEGKSNCSYQVPQKIQSNEISMQMRTGTEF